MVSINNTASLQALDLDILTQYTQAIGGEALLGSVDIFEQQFPLYIDNLLSFYRQGDNKGVTEEAHKMKGAAGAVGLLRLAALSQKIQDSSAADWATNYPQYIQSIETCYAADVVELREYLTSC